MTNERTQTTGPARGNGAATLARIPKSAEADNIRRTRPPKKFPTGSPTLLREPEAKEQKSGNAKKVCMNAGLGDFQARSAGRPIPSNSGLPVSLSAKNADRAETPSKEDARQGLGQAIFLPAGYQFEGLALHHPAQRILFPDAQARPRGPGQRRRHHGPRCRSSGTAWIAGSG